MASKKVKIIGGIIGGFALFGIGAGAGAAGGAPEAVTVEKRVEVPVEKVVTKEVKVDVEKTPASCIRALDLAGEAMGIMAQVADLGGDTAIAAGTGNVRELNSITAQLEALNVEIVDLNAPTATAASDCRSKQ